MVYSGPIRFVDELTAVILLIASDVPRTHSSLFGSKLTKMAFKTIVLLPNFNRSGSRCTHLQVPANFAAAVAQLLFWIQSWTCGQGLFLFF